MSEPKVKREKIIQAEIHDNGAKADEHRQVAFIQGVESRRENFVRGIGDESDRITTQGKRGLFGGEGVETSVLVNQADDRIGENDQADGGRNREQHYEPDRVGKRAAKFFLVAERCAARNER